ncbi:unnamed protein product [Moneuplotes crassus]|uniref:Uncharacterized protein n=1 Tax=Euplotes crassus TaxID=5936 RepID=A0AAD1XYP7_EUPCR|nr:unnamed protein product [Moneuplotes crassus]
MSEEQQKKPDDIKDSAEEEKAPCPFNQPIRGSHNVVTNNIASNIQNMVPSPAYIKYRGTLPMNSA